MPTNHDVWDNVSPTDGTPGNSFEFLINLFRLDSPTIPRLIVDQTNVNPAFTPKMRQRQTAAVKGVDISSKYADSLVVTFDMEVVRDDNGQFSRDMQELIDAAKQNGKGNQRRMQFFDALGADLAIDGVFGIQFARSGIDWDSASFITFTCSQARPIQWIDNPVLTGLAPTIGSVEPPSRPVGETLFIQGSNFSTMTTTPSNVTFGAVNATRYDVVNDSLIVAVIPTVPAGPTALKVHNPSGDTTVTYTVTGS